jgi:hypothetical protein
MLLDSLLVGTSYWGASTEGCNLFYFILILYINIIYYLFLFIYKSVNLSLGVKYWGLPEIHTLRKHRSVFYTDE